MSGGGGSAEAPCRSQILARRGRSKDPSTGTTQPVAAQSPGRATYEPADNFKLRRQPLTLLYSAIRFQPLLRAVPEHELEKRIPKRKAERRHSYCSNEDSNQAVRIYLFRYFRLHEDNSQCDEEKQID
jgi:hypothetical protein